MEEPPRGESVSDLLLVPGPGAGKFDLVAGCLGRGLFRNTWDGTEWSGSFFINGYDESQNPIFPASFSRIALGLCRDEPGTIYAAFSHARSIAAIMKSTNRGVRWKRVTPPIKAYCEAETTRGADNHYHGVILDEALLGQTTAQTVTTTPGPGLHTHTVDIFGPDLLALASGDPVRKFTSADPDDGHVHSVVLDRRISWQTEYNFHITVHPTKPDTVYYGEIGLWKTSTGDGPWSPAGQGIHADQHGLVFDPGDPEVMWAVNDGGAYRFQGDGADGGTWTHRNGDLATLQYVHCSSHPDWDAVMLGGTQDNGTHRYAGHPSWQPVTGGDGGFTAIDQINPRNMYTGYVRNTILVSRDAGTSWYYFDEQSDGCPTGVALFYPPFVLDPLDPAVAYFGNDRLWRSEGHADSGTWRAIAGPFKDGGIVSAIAVHPTDMTTVYLATTRGQVYRVHRTGDQWDPAEDLTAAPLPPGVCISDLAVHAGGTVWATVSSILEAESPGEFENDHVYRLPPGAAAWESRSRGLARANPINTIVIDPYDASGNRLFCGGDVGVFRTDDAGECWIAWDEGLPDAPVLHLDLHVPSRLLRAATHGRSVWERVINRFSSLDADLYIRDSILDTGRSRPSPNDEPHPFDAGHRVFWWQSPDIKVDSKPGFQTTALVADALGFESLSDGGLRRNSVNRVYVQVHNRGPRPANDVKVRAFVSFSGDAPLPNDFWSDGHPFAGNPDAADWIPLGDTRTIDRLEAAEPGVVAWEYSVGNVLYGTPTIVALTTCGENPLDGSGIHDVNVLAPNRKHVALRTVELVGAWVPPEFTWVVRLHEAKRYIHVIPRDLQIRWGNLPKGAAILVAFEEMRDGKAAVLASTKDLKGEDIRVGRAGGALAGRLQKSVGAKTRLDLTRVYRLERPTSRISVIPGVRIPTDRGLGMVLHMVVPRDWRPAPLQWDVVLWSGKDIISGATCMLRPALEKKRR